MKIKLFFVIFGHIYSEIQQKYPENTSLPQKYLKNSPVPRKYSRNNPVSPKYQQKSPVSSKCPENSSVIPEKSTRRKKEPADVFFITDDDLEKLFQEHDWTDIFDDLTDKLKSKVALKF